MKTFVFHLKSDINRVVCIFLPMDNYIIYVKIYAVHGAKLSFNFLTQKELSEIRYTLYTAYIGRVK